MARRTVPIAAAARHERVLKDKFAAVDAVRDKAAIAEFAEMSEFGATDAGNALRRQYAERREAKIREWLAASPKNPDFPTTSIALHAELSMLDRILSDLTPKDERNEGEKNV